MAAQMCEMPMSDDFDAIAAAASPARSLLTGRGKGTKAKTQLKTQNAGSAIGSLVNPTAAGATGQDIAENKMDTAENPAFLSIEKLQDQGINAADIKKMKEAGLNSAMAVIYTTKKDLCNVKGLSEQKVEKIQEAARKLTDAGFVTGVQYLKNKHASRFHLSTGSSNVDKLLGGGVESSSITEIFGEFRCGKTQICHSLSVIAQMPKEYGGANGKVCYIDTESTFRPDRVEQIAQAYGLAPEQVLNNIIYARCFNVDHMMQLLLALTAKMAEDRFALLIVDSIMAPFRVDFSGRGELAERQQVLGKLMNRLQKISEEFNVAVVLTNQVMSDPAGGMTFTANMPKPIGGHIMAHFSTTRLSLRKGRGEQRIMKIFDSPCLPEGDAVYEICTKGIQDAKD